MRKIIPVFLLAILSCGCARQLQLIPVASERQEEAYINGVKTLISTKKNVGALRPYSPVYSSRKRPSLVVFLWNRSEFPINFSTENIKVFVNDEPVRIFTYEELVAEVEKRKRTRAILAAITGTLAAFSAATSGYTYHSGTVTTPYGTSFYSGYSYNPSVSAYNTTVANLQTEWEFERIKEEAETALDTLSRTILRKQTVYPGQKYGGCIILQKIPLRTTINKMIVKVNVGSEEHVFYLEQSLASGKL